MNMENDTIKKIERFFLVIGDGNDGRRWDFRWDPTGTSSFIVRRIAFHCSMNSNVKIESKSIENEIAEKFCKEEKIGI